MTILILNEQGIHTWRLKLGTIIPWRDVEGYKIDINETSTGIKFRTLVFKIRNQEKYLKKNWTGSYPNIRVGISWLTETPEAICRYLDQALAGHFPPAPPEADKG